MKWLAVIDGALVGITACLVVCGTIWLTASSLAVSIVAGLAMLGCAVLLVWVALLRRKAVRRR